MTSQGVISLSWVDRVCSEVVCAPRMGSLIAERIACTFSAGDTNKERRLLLTR